MRAPLNALVTLLVGVAVLAFPYIDLAADLDVAGRHLDTPVADLAGAGLVVMAGLILLGAGGEPPATPPRGDEASRFRLPGAPAYAVLVAAGLVGLAVVPEPGPSAWFLLRKPVFLYVAYGAALAWLVATRLSVGALRDLLRATLVVTATVSLATSVGRIAAGNTLWFAAIEGLTNNHKTLAVAMAPLVPLVLAMRRSRVDGAVVGYALVAIALSLSRTAWIASTVGLAFVVVWRGRALAARRGLVAGVVVVGVLAALYGPILVGSHAQMDAARSRHSLDKRAIAMFVDHPVLGMGGGANVRYEMLTFPHYRVNGVDAHGAVQKVASEYGAVGLAGWLGFVGSMAARLRRRAHEARPAEPLRDGLVAPDLALGAWAAFVALHVNLLLSTETFSQTHWIPLGIAWGLSFRAVAAREAPVGAGEGPVGAGDAPVGAGEAPVRAASPAAEASS